jgi:toxin secretion/phage lysis holin
MHTTLLSAAIDLASFAISAELGNMILMLFILIWADFISGILASRKSGAAIKSSSLHRTVIKIASYGLALLVVLSIKFMSISDVAWNGIALVSLTFFLANEGFSILENLDRLGLKLPKTLKKLLKEKSSDEDQDD